MNQEQQLHILELKNSEDRYVVQQLTRYFDNLISTAALPERIDGRIHSGAILNPIPARAHSVGFRNLVEQEFGDG